MPPERLSVLDDKGSHIPNYVLGPYKEGDNVAVTCIASGGRPSPNVTWWLENALLDDSFQQDSDRVVKNVLRLENVSREYLHREFTCQASNNNLGPPLSSSVTLDLNCK